MQSYTTVRTQYIFVIIFIITLLNMKLLIFNHLCCSFAQSCPTLCDPIESSMPSLSVPHHLPKLSLALVMPSSHSILWCLLLLLLSIFFSIRIFSNESAPKNTGASADKILEFQLQHQSFQWVFRVDFP